MAPKTVVSDSKLRVGLLQAEKRLIDLELSVTELKDKLKDVDFEGITGLKEKVDELEDLVMVENAGIIELKKMLEEMQGKLAPEAKISPEIETRVTSVEKRLTSLPVTEGSIDNLKDQINTITNELTGLRSEVEKGIREVREKSVTLERPTVDVRFLSQKVDSLKTTVDELVNKKIEAEMKIQTLERVLTSKEDLPGNLLDEMKNVRKEWLTVAGRVDSLEKVLSEISENIPKIQSQISKFETFERASLLSKELETKIEQFKFIESETKRLSTKIEMIYDSIDKRLDKVREMEKKFPILSGTISKIEKDIDANKVQIIDRVKKDEINQSLEEIRKQFDEFENSINRRINDVGRKVNVGEIRKELENFRVGMENKIDSKIGNIMSSIDKRLAGVQAPMWDMQMNELVNKLVFLESKLGAIEKLMRDTSTMQPIIIE